MEPSSFCNRNDRIVWSYFANEKWKNIIFVFMYGNEHALDLEQGGVAR